ncbi:MAG: hypothetical protein G01um101466_201 [Parcubacteria group bacterium Gr01-1014_66]|nr:MAG: hypothetical protein G01um101466_201 [Parcubacteria group bacterium Gr01-1014_66]
MKIFADTLGVDSQTLHPLTAFNSHENWDSLKQLEIVNELEKAFHINLSTDDMIEMETIKKTEGIVARHLA